MLLDKYLPRIDFDSYEDFKANYRVNVPADFNFGFDIVDEWAKQEPEKKALVWCDDEGGDRTFTFTDISRLSNQAANYFTSLGIRKGTVVMLILRRRLGFPIPQSAGFRKLTKSRRKRWRRFRRLPPDLFSPVSGAYSYRVPAPSTMAS